MFLALVGLAFWFGRGERPEPVSPSAEPVPARPPADDVPTGEPAKTRERANRASTTFAAAATGHVHTLLELLDSNPLVSRLEQLDATGWSALHHAAYGDQLPALRVLLEKGANPNAVAEGECVPLHMAAAQGSVEVVQALLDAGADPNLPDDAGSTALHYAALPCRTAVIEALLAGGALPNMKDVHQEAPLDIALRHQDTSAADALKAAGGKRASAFKMAETRALLGDSPAASFLPSRWYLPADGPWLQRAGEQAQAGLPAFLAKLEQQPEARSAIKFALRNGEIVEHVWGEIETVGAPLTVRLSASPVAVPMPEQPVEVAHDEVVDWQMLLEDGRVAGGYAQRATYEALRDEFGALPSTIEDELARYIDL